MSPTDPGIRRALVTGGASGLGRACARRLRDDHHEVITADIADGADVRLDVTDDAAVAEVVSQLGPIDILLNSAGIVGPNRPLWETTRAEWDGAFAVNVHGTVAMCRAVVPGMVGRGWGRVVNFASMAGKDGNPNLSAYSATKAAVIGLTKSLGKELAVTGVLVNAIAPGGDRHRDERQDRAGGPGPHHQPDPDEAGGSAGGGGRTRGVAGVRAVLVLDRRGLRHQRRPGDVLGLVAQVDGVGVVSPTHRYPPAPRVWHIDEGGVDLPRARVGRPAGVHRWPAAAHRPGGDGQRRAVARQAHDPQDLVCRVARLLARAQRKTEHDGDGGPVVSHPVGPRG